MAHIVTKLESPKEVLAQFNALMKAGCWEQAIQLANKHPQLLHANFDASWNVGWAYYKLERYTESIPLG